MLDIVKKIKIKTSPTGENAFIGCDSGEFLNKKPTVLTNYWSNCSVYYRTIYDGDQVASFSEWSESGDIYTITKYICDLDEMGVKTIPIKYTKQPPIKYKRGEVGYIEPEKDLTILEDYNKYVSKVAKEEMVPELAVLNGKEFYVGGEGSIVIKNGQYMKYYKGSNKRLL
jgi:hypothetical protein